MSEEDKETLNNTSDMHHPAASAANLPRLYGQIPGSNPAAGRKTWTEVVGLPAEEAEKKIKEEMPGVQIQVVPPDRLVTADFRFNRVRLHVDSSGKVAKAPIVG